MECGIDPKSFLSLKIEQSSEARVVPDEPQDTGTDMRTPRKVEGRAEAPVDQRKERSGTRAVAPSRSTVERSGETASPIHLSRTLPINTSTMHISAASYNASARVKVQTRVSHSLLTSAERRAHGSAYSAQKKQVARATPAQQCNPSSAPRSPT